MVVMVVVVVQMKMMDDLVWLLVVLGVFVAAADLAPAWLAQNFEGKSAGSAGLKG